MCPCNITMSESSSIEARSLQRYWKGELCKDAMDGVCLHSTCVREDYFNVNLTGGGYANYTLRGCGLRQQRFECCTKNLFLVVLDVPLAEVLSIKHYAGSSKVSAYFRGHCKQQNGCESDVRTIAYGDVPKTARQYWLGAFRSSRLFLLHIQRRRNYMDERTGSTDSDSEWVKDLEVAIASDCDFNTIRLLAENRSLTDELRSPTWQILLGVSHKANPFVGQDDLFDLPEQHEIRAACSKLCKNLGNCDGDRLAIVSDLESVITLFSKTCNVQFCVENGWTDLLQLLVALRLPRSQLYHVFFTLTTKYIPKDCWKNEQPFDLFRLLLVYHEPEFCSFLDSLRLSPATYCKRWFNSLFSSSCKLNVALKLLDVYLQHADPFEIFFMALVIMINSKNQILAMEGQPENEIAEQISSFPSQLQEEDIDDFYQLVQFYMNRTPQSFRRDYHGPLFGSNFTEMVSSSALPVLCLSVSPQELLPLVVGVKNQHINFAIVDTRSREEFASGHIRGSFTLDVSQLLADPVDFNRTVDELEAKCNQVDPDLHWCLLSSGLESDDSVCYMCVAFLLKRKKRYVSMALGGYNGIHSLLKGHLMDKLEAHDSRRCLACLHAAGRCIPEASVEEMQISPRFDFLDSASMSIFNRSASVVRRLKKALSKSPPAKGGYRHVSPSSRHGKPYRGTTSVFSIDDEGDVSDDESSEDEFNAPQEVVTVSDWLRASDVIGSFECKQLEKAGRSFKSLLVLKGDCLCVLRLVEDSEDQAVLRAKHPLSSVGKITSRHMFPELLSFTFYGVGKGDEEPPTKVERYVVEKAGDCAKMVKQAILDPLR
uniref:TBC1 domain family member 23 n=1 Tax=Trichuris muris TaxID=70415 RepID=A0A5S6Q1W8_TRIMR